MSQPSQRQHLVNDSSSSDPDDKFPASREEAKADIDAILASKDVYLNDKMVRGMLEA